MGRYIFSDRLSFPHHTKVTASSTLALAKLALLMFSLVSAFCSTTHAQQSTEQVLAISTHTVLELDAENIAPTDLTPLVTWYVDESRDLTLSDIVELPDSAFVKNATIPSFGYTQDIIWYRFDISVAQPLAQQAFLEIQPSYLNFIDLFLFKQGLPEPVWRGNLGDNIPASVRPYQGGTHVTALPLLNKGDYRMYIRVQSNSTNFILLNLWPIKELVSSLTYRNLATHIFFGLFATMGIAYLALGVIARDSVVGLYGAWTIAIGTVVAIVNGLILSEIRPETPWLNDFFLGAINIFAHAATVFLWLYIINFHKTRPLLFALGCAYALIILSFAFGAATNLYIVFGTYIIPSHALFMSMMCLVLVKRLIDDHRNWLLWYYLVILAFPTIVAITAQLAHAGLITATPLRLEMHQFTISFHMIAMGVLMAFRLTHMDRERISATLQAQETTTLVEEQRKLISMLSHEFRTPLAVIQRSAEMLMLRLTERGADVQDRLQRIQLQARKLARLVDVFLSKDGIDNQEFSLARDLVSLNPFMDEFVANITREDAKVYVTGDGTAHFEAFIDETLIALAITNLVETSRQFSHGKTIHIGLNRHTNGIVEIMIPCSGAELDDDEIRLIGDALFRREMETKSLRNALGLHISQRIVASHGGSIKLRDRGSEGIELCLLLPCEETGPHTRHA